MARKRARRPAANPVEIQVQPARASAAPKRAARAPDRLLVYGTVPLRVFLGLTFIYAGLQKIADPGFLQPGSSTYIGTQLASFAVRSPIGFAINSIALPDPQLAGTAVIVTELAVGALVLLGIATRWAALVGAAVNFVFFLTASWTVQPYFLGSDSIYTVAWITLAIVGDQGLTARWLFIGDSPEKVSRWAADPGRRRMLLTLGGGAVGVVWVLALLPRTRALTGAITPSPSPTSTSSPAATTPPAPSTPQGTRIGSLADIQSQGSLTFTDPHTGDPSVALQLPGGSVVAFDAVCTHAGCQVNYDSSQRLLVCPCHGAEFDPANAAAVVAGPAPTPLGVVKVQVASDGGVYAM